MNEKSIERIYIWSGPVAAVLFFIGLFPLAHLLPPPINPSTPAADVAAFYTQHRMGILFGEIFVLWASCLMMPFILVVFTQVRRIERGFPYLSAMYLFCAGIVDFEIIIPAWNFSTIALRVSRPVDVTLALSDQAWLMYVWPNPQTVLMFLTVGIAILRDPNPKPLFPRWLGFFNLAGALLFVGSTFCNMAYSGPFSWTGLMAFWLPAIDFGNWFILMTFALLKAIKRDDYEATSRIAG